MARSEVSGESCRCRGPMEGTSNADQRREREEHVDKTRGERSCACCDWVAIPVFLCKVQALIYLVRSRDQVDRMMTEKRVGAYVGIDPTASSLHVGHMLPLMSLFWMYVHGYHTISLLGGATAKIGDPTDRLTTRENTRKSIRTQNMWQMHYQLKKLWLNVEAYGRKYGYKSDWAWKRALLNNNTWMNHLTIMEFLQVLGPGMRLGSMLARDT